MRRADLDLIVPLTFLVKFTADLSLKSSNQCSNSIVIWRSM